MLTVLSAFLLLQQAQAPRQAVPHDTMRTSADSAGADSVAVRTDSGRGRGDRAARRVPVTPELERSAFDDAGARELLRRARAARLAQDTTLAGYDATAYQRISAGMAIRRLGRERLLFRREVAARVRWQRGVGATVDVLGGRQALPMITGSGRRKPGQVSAEIRREMAQEFSSDNFGDVPIPYYPGQESLLIGSGLAKMEVNERELVHPIAMGAEAYYRYALGDSVIFRLPDGRTIRLRELRVRPRQPKWNLGVGSLWFDASSAQLVRAVYRLSVPMDIWEIVREEDPDDIDDIPIWVRPMIMPMRATVSAMTVEYGLHEGRFWLPRLQAVEAEAEMSFMRVPVRLEQSFKYARVSGTGSGGPPMVAEDAVAERERLRAWSDSMAARRAAIRELPAEQRDSARKALRAEIAATGTPGGCGAPRDSRTTMRREFDGALDVLVHVPCDTAVLAHSSELPASLYDPGEELFGQRELDALVSEALTLGVQPDWAPQRPTLHYGLGEGLLRYNRVEGLSPGVMVRQELGRGFSARALARIGTADWEPRGELALSRSDGRRTFEVAAYNRLGVANDWGDPLGFGASLTALAFGRDEGFYYRTLGAELRALGSTDGLLDARLFVERHRAAPVETQFSLPNAFGDHEFLPNIVAERGTTWGVAARAGRTWGLDPDGARLFAQGRGEVGAGNFGYARGLLDLTASRPLLAGVEGALTMSGGGSVGTVPAQRRYYLGGPQTIRGQDGGAMAGDAYWMVRTELARGWPVVRPTLYYDMGWAGDRTTWRHPGTPASGAGIGASIMDGMLRADLSRGIRPERQWRVDLYLEARF
ncbi:MAG TPA: ShlB/FhaC/HecB family hemolysin secretion/activation protein [Gemmatimonadaceae bacterium]|nr:ShlB/FhaC/HecB family hemolysin secretion/activation protein [Gemmatimonadaceae bacterium]